MNLLAGKSSLSADGTVVGVGDITFQEDRVAATMLTKLKSVRASPADVVFTGV